MVIIESILYDILPGGLLALIPPCMNFKGIISCYVCSYVIVCHKNKHNDALNWGNCACLSNRGSICVYFTSQSEIADTSMNGQIVTLCTFVVKLLNHLHKSLSICRMDAQDELEVIVKCDNYVQVENYFRFMLQSSTIQCQLVRLMFYIC